MKKHIQTLAVIISCFLVSSCIYESTVPIEAATVKIDPNLLGSWKADERKNNSQQNVSSKIITLSKQDEYNYTIQIKQDNKAEIEVIHGFLSIVNGVVFLNAWDNIPEGSPKGYHLMKLEKINENSIKLYPLSENIKEQFKSSRELKEFVAANMSNSYFFESPYSCNRVN